MRSTDRGVSWETAIRLTNDPARSGFASIAVSSSVVHVAWGDLKPGNFEIYYMRSTDGGTSWEEEQRLTDDMYVSGSPTISLSGSYVHLAWVNSDNDAGIYKVFYKHSSDGGISWEDESLLSENSTIAYNASMAVSGSDVYVAWHDYRDGNREIYYKGSIDGGEHWGEDTRISFDPATSNLPNLAISDSALHVVWQDDRSGLNDVYYNYSTNGGKNWAEDTKLNDWSYSSERPFIDASDSVLHVIWCDFRDGNYEIYYKRNPTGGIPVAIDENTENISTVIYPNPASRQLTVGQLDNWIVGQLAVDGRRSAVRLSIVDLYGREIKAFRNISSFPYMIDISDLSDGVYLLRVMDEEGRSGSAKFLKIAE